MELKNYLYLYKESTIIRNYYYNEGKDKHQYRILKLWVAANSDKFGKVYTIDYHDGRGKFNLIDPSTFELFIISLEPWMYRLNLRQDLKKSKMWQQSHSTECKKQMSCLVKETKKPKCCNGLPSTSSEKAVSSLLRPTAPVFIAGHCYRFKTVEELFEINAVVDNAGRFVAAPTGTPGWHFLPLDVLSILDDIEFTPQIRCETFLLYKYMQVEPWMCVDLSATTTSKTE